MVTLLVRTLLIYIILILTVRLMGKRQIGELEVTDLVTTLLISEIASLPITSPEIPVLYAVVPMFTLLSLEVFSSLILVKFPKLKGLVSASPTVIVSHGQLRQKALNNLRISPDELMSEVRRQGLTDLSDVDTAIVEKNGKLTLLPNPDQLPPTAKQLGIKVKSDPLMHIIYNNGSFDENGLSLIGKDRKWLKKQLNRRGIREKDLFFVTGNESGKLFWVRKEPRK